MTSRDIGDFQHHPEAAAEVAAAVDRYTQYSVDSGDRFYQAVRKLLNEIPAWTGAGPKWPGWDREPQVYSYGIKGYPFRIVYFVREGEPVILAYAHEKQLPGYWRHRADAFPQ